MSHDHNIASDWPAESPRRSRHDRNYSAVDRNRYKEGRFGIVLDVSTHCRQDQLGLVIEVLSCHLLSETEQLREVVGAV